MKLVHEIYESDTCYREPCWISFERGVKVGEIRVICEILFYAESVISADKPWGKPRVRWQPVTKEMIYTGEK